MVVNSIKTLKAQGSSGKVVRFNLSKAVRGKVARIISKETERTSSKKLSFLFLFIQNF